jgi:alpha-1,6-mannosyltransferase
VLVLAMMGLLVEICFVGMALLRDLSGHMIPFLAFHGVASLGYGTAVYLLLRGRCGSDGKRALPAVFSLAILFRITLLFATPPTLSSDVYRYIWDGRMMNAGINPYAHAVNSPLLDRFDSPQRALVNHSWMASPYLPVAQLFFATVYRLAPDSPLAFQIAAVLLDLLTGWLVLDLLRRLGMPQTWALIYLWNPLVVVEFAHGAHLDALMICLVIAALWCLIAARSALLSAMALAAATLTKGLPALLVPILARRWGWRYTLAYAVVVAAACTPFGLGGGWGLVGPLDGEGLFGALRIYTAYWRFYAGLYHWLELGLSSLWTTVAAAWGAIDWPPVLAARLTVLVALGLVVIVVWRKGRRCSTDLALLRLALVLLAAYLLLATTVHPWYVTLVVPFLPFLPSRDRDIGRTGRLLLPWLYFSAVVSLSYLTYLDPANPRESDVVRLVGYVPLYVLLVWSALLWAKKRRV